MTDEEKSLLWDYVVVVRELSGASDLEIRNLFKRLNLNSETLNDQELRHAALSGHFIKTMEELANDEWWLHNKVVTVRQIRRMEDVEYVSELFIGLVAGPQDKKKTLDEYYENYDATMPDKAKWVDHFERTLEIIKKTLPPEDIKTWSGKSDFYSLFHSIGSLTDKNPTIAERKRIAEELRRLRTAVDAGKKKDAKDIRPKDVAQYVEALTRAASDRGRRELRQQIIEKRLSSILERPGKKNVAA